MTYDFSHLYKTETIALGTTEKGEPITITLREIPHGEFVELQKAMMGELTISKNKRDIERQLSNIKFSAPEFADRKSVLGIQSWTLKDANGIDVPVCLEAWRQLPHHVTEAIEEAIDRLNPEIDEEFQDES